MSRRLLKSKKLARMGIFGVLLLLTMLNGVQVYYLPFAHATTPRYIFTDDFEDYDVGTIPPTWETESESTEYPGEVVVSDDQCYSPQKSLNIIGSSAFPPGGGVEHYKQSAFRTFDTEFDILTCELQFYDDYRWPIFFEFWGMEKVTEIRFDWPEMDLIGAYDARKDEYVETYYSIPSKWFKIQMTVDLRFMNYTVRAGDFFEAKDLGIIQSSLDGGKITSIRFSAMGKLAEAFFDDVKVFEGSQPPEPEVEVSVVNRYETNRLVNFLYYVLFGIRYPIDCIIEATILDYSNIERVYLELTGATPNTIDLAKISEGHYKVEITAIEEFGAEEIRDIAYLFLKLLFAYNSPVGGTLAPAPWAYSEPPDYVVTVDELVIAYEGGGEFRKRNPISPLPRLPTYKDAIESMLPIWGSDPFGTTIVALSPVDILVTDPSGRRVGAVYENGVFVAEVNEIQGSFYIGKDFTPEFIYVPNHPGQYEVQIVGVETGEYVLDILLQGEDGPIFKEFSGSVVEGTIHEYGIEVIPEFPSFLILPLFMIATLLACVLLKKRKHLSGDLC